MVRAAQLVHAITFSGEVHSRGETQASCLPLPRAIVSTRCTCVRLPRGTRGLLGCRTGEGGWLRSAAAHVSLLRARRRAGAYSKKKQSAMNNHLANHLAAFLGAQAGVQEEDDEDDDASSVATNPYEAPDDEEEAGDNGGGPPAAGGSMGILA